MKTLYIVKIPIDQVIYKIFLLTPIMVMMGKKIILYHPSNKINGSR